MPVEEKHNLGYVENHVEPAILAGASQARHLKNNSNGYLVRSPLFLPPPFLFGPVDTKMITFVTIATWSLLPLLT
jgi:hypothetical protein